jgi:transposase
MNAHNSQNQINVGVDVSKKQLDIYICPLDIHFTVTNDAKGIKQDIKQISRHNVIRVIVEATGRYEHAFAVACAKTKLPFVITNPIRVRRFAESIGQLAKTPKIYCILAIFWLEETNCSRYKSWRKIDSKLCLNSCLV